MKPIEDPSPPEHVLVTGFPSFTATRMAQKLLAGDPTSTVELLVRDRWVRSAHEMLEGLPPAQARRARVLQGDVLDLDLGLSGPEVRQLADSLTTIHHLAGFYRRDADPKIAERVHVNGTRNVIELAKECKRLRRLCHWSTASVSGRRRGVVLEDELDLDQRFHDAVESTKAQAEHLARTAQRSLPLTIFRPTTIVGDSKTGEIDRFDGPYFLMVLIVNGPTEVPLPLPGRGTAPMHLVPIDYVIDAAFALSRDPRAAGHTFHLCDPNPYSVRQVFELVAERAQKPRPRGFIPTGIARAIMKTPGLGELARAPLELLDSLDHVVLYNARHAAELLAGTGLTCPPLDSYVDNLVRYVREVHAARRQKLEDDAWDPFG